MPVILAVEAALPPHYYAQAEVAAAIVELGSRSGALLDAGRVERFFGAVGVQGRHLAWPLKRYLELSPFSTRNTAWLTTALELGTAAVSGLLKKTEVAAKTVDLFISTTVTGIAVPSLEAYLMNRLGFSTACRRLPLLSLGCVGGAAGIARAADYLRAYPTHCALLLSVELCSLTLQTSDVSNANLIASGLFGDGAAAVLMVGDDHPGAGRIGAPSVVDSRSVLFPDTEGVMGWQVVDSGFRVILSPEVPTLARSALARSIREFLSERRLTVRDIDVWVAHPGGPAVIDAMEQGLELGPDALGLSRECLARMGNISSASVLMILKETLERVVPPSSKGLLLAMGPGFCAELVLLEW